MTYTTADLVKIHVVRIVIKNQMFESLQEPVDPQGVLLTRPGIHHCPLSELSLGHLVFKCLSLCWDRRHSSSSEFHFVSITLSAIDDRQGVLHDPTHDRNLSTEEQAFLNLRSLTTQMYTAQGCFCSV